MAVAGTGMIKGLDNVYYYVTDMKRSLAFYNGILGIPIDYSDDHWTSLNVHGVKFGLHLANAGEFFKSSEKRGGSIVVLAVTDIDEACEYYKSKGVQFDEISRNPWGNHVAFSDPDGNLLELRQGPK